MKNTLIGIMLPVMAASAALSAQTESLISAAARGDKKKIVRLLEEGADINKPEKLVMEGPFYVCETKIIKDASPILAALAYNHVSLARWMITKGANPKYTTKDGGYQATHIAAFNGYSEPVMYLGLRYRMSLDQKDARGFDVYQAAQGGNIKRRLACYRTLQGFKEIALDAQNDLMFVPLSDSQKRDAQKYISDDIGLVKALEDCTSIGVKMCCENGHNPFREINLGGYNRYNGYSAYKIAEEREDDLHLGYFDYLKENGKF